MKTFLASLLGICCFTQVLIAQDMLPLDFPKSNPENPELYDLAKQDWIERNPEQYQELADLTTLYEEGPTDELPDMDLNIHDCYNQEEPTILADTKTWQLADITIVDNSDKISPEELKALQEDLQSDESANYYLKISPNGKLATYRDDKFTGQFNYTLENDFLNLSPVAQNECNQNQSYKLVKWDKEKISYLRANEDGATITYQFNFLPSK